MKEETIFSCLWEVETRLMKTGTLFSVRTETAFFLPCDLKKNGEPKANAGKEKLRLVTVGNLKLANHICIAHNMMVTHQSPVIIEQQIDKMKNELIFILGLRNNT